MVLSRANAQVSREILVAAAADLAPAREWLSESFAKSTGYRVRFTFGASGMLARQIAEGAPYDVYLSANEGFVDQLQASHHLVPDTVQIWAQGRLGLWSKGGKIRALADLADPAVRHVAIANPAHAPYGVAAREALKKKGLWDKLAAKIVYGENVVQTFQFAETGNAEAAITAWSLVFDKGGILLPGEWHSPIRQKGGAVAGSKNAAAGRQFMTFLSGREGKAILRQFGFD